MKLVFLLLLLVPAAVCFAQLPPIEPGVSQDLAKWRSVQYSNISYKLDLTLEKMSPVLKGSIEIHVTQAASACAEPNCPPLYLILDWRKLPGHEKDSTISNVTLNGRRLSTQRITFYGGSGEGATIGSPSFSEANDHLVFHDGVRMGENVITLDFTSPILTSGSAITRYIDKEDGSEYIYSLFVPSDASTAFPVFDQPDLKARFSLTLTHPSTWRAISNSRETPVRGCPKFPGSPECVQVDQFNETLPISSYVFAFAAGPFTDIQIGTPYPQDVPIPARVFVRRSQFQKFTPHASAVGRLVRDGINYLSTYFDYKFPWPKYDLVLIPEFPFGGMEHAGATFLKESSVIFPTEPTKGDEISRANVIFHETAHQWFGDLVTMRWFDDLWLKEGFAEFMAYKTLEHVMPDANAWKVFYERNKQAAYATDSTRGTTPIYQPIANLSAAKSAYGNIVYRKAPSFLRQAEFYLGPDKFQTAIRAFLKKHEYGNAGWEDLVGEFENASGQKLQDWGKAWVTSRGMPVIRVRANQMTANTGSVKTETWYQTYGADISWSISDDKVCGGGWKQKSQFFYHLQNGGSKMDLAEFGEPYDLCSSMNVSPGWPTFRLLEVQLDKEQQTGRSPVQKGPPPTFIFPNYGDYGYGVFLLDDKSRDYVLKHIGEEKDPFLRSMMWGALWDSVREAELDPREYVELVIRQLGANSSVMSPAFRRPGADPKLPLADAKPPKGGTQSAPVDETDETTIQSLLGRVSTAMNYYLDPTTRERLAPQFEAILLDRMQHAETPGQRITFYRAFVTNASTEHSRSVLKAMLAQVSGSRENRPVGETPPPLLRKEGSPNAPAGLQLRTKDRFDIVTRLAILGDPDAPTLLANLEKTETSDDAKRYAYAAHAAFATPENRAKFWTDFINNKDISESWIEAAIGPFNSIRHPELSQPYLARALQELPDLKRTRKIFFINNWLSAWLGGQRDQAALDIVNKFLADNPNLDNDLRLKVLENVDVIERAVRIRAKYGKNY